MPLASRAIAQRGAQSNITASRHTQPAVFLPGATETWSNRFMANPRSITHLRCPFYAEPPPKEQTRQQFRPAGAKRPSSVPRFLDLPASESQTEFMAHIYLTFDFARDEEKAQQARHKLEGWKQAFRLDKKLLYKVERTAPSDGEAKPVKVEKSKTKGKGKAGAAAAEVAAPSSSDDIKLLVRL